MTLLERLAARERAAHALLLYGATLGCAAVYLATLPLSRRLPAGDRVTLLFVLPDAVRYLDLAYHAAAGLFALSAALLVARRFLRAAAAGAFLGYATAVSLYLERRPYVDHTLQLVALVLLHGALWLVLADDGPPPRAGLREWATRGAAPRWVVGLSRLAVGAFYTWSGLAKLHTSGLDWANGVSLQVWVQAFGRPGRLASRLLEDVALAAALQWAVLAAELLALPALAHPATRTMVGLVLLAFHAGQWLLFGWEFHANAVLLVLLYLPVDRLLRGRTPG